MSEGECVASGNEHVSECLSEWLSVLESVSDGVEGVQRRVSE